MQAAEYEYMGRLSAAFSFPVVGFARALQNRLFESPEMHFCCAVSSVPFPGFSRTILNLRNAAGGFFLILRFTRNQLTE